eukprot:scaffold5127_cov191-Skeletonema_dohrnii-CCMP3373.AAC.4
MNSHVGKFPLFVSPDEYHCHGRRNGASCGRRLLLRSRRHQSLISIRYEASRRNGHCIARDESKGAANQRSIG